MFNNTNSSEWRDATDNAFAESLPPQGYGREFLDRTLEPSAFEVRRADRRESARLDEMVPRLMHSPDLDQLLRTDEQQYRSPMERLRLRIAAAFNDRDEDALTEMHRVLFFLYEQHFADPASPEAVNQFHPLLIRIRNDIERAWLASEASRARSVDGPSPATPEAFASAFKEICFNHPLARHPLFDFLEHQAQREQMVAFFRSDSALILRFCDLISTAMVGADDEIRGELAVNLWDEMGNGDAAQRHTALFRRFLAYIGADDDFLSPEAAARQMDWQGLAGYNLHLCLSIHRSHYFKYVGCLGSSELMDAPQYAKVLKGCRRVGLNDDEKLAYYANHVSIDAAHGQDWLDKVLVPLVAKSPKLHDDIILGARMRLNITHDYFTSVLRNLSTQKRTDRRGAAADTKLEAAFELAR
jgi:hypothetical protein